VEIFRRYKLVTKITNSTVYVNVINGWPLIGYKLSDDGVSLDFASWWL